MKSRFIAAFFLLCFFIQWTPAEGRIKLDGSTPNGVIINSDPKDVDPTGLPLTPVDSLHFTGTYQYVDRAAWRLAVTGPGAKKPLSLRG